jgi:hypothetical protein
MVRFRAALCFIAASLASGCAWFDFHPIINESVGTDVTGTDQAVRAFLTGHTLDPIEGAWEHDENEFEVVIARNRFDVAAGYDYVGIITRTDDPQWHEGDIKLQLKSTGSPDVFDGVWMTSNQSRTPMTFVFENRNLIQASFVSTDGNTYFVRIRRMNQRLAGRF